MIGFVVFLVLVGLVVMWLRGRRRRARQLSGTTSARPVFSVEPPSRRLGRLKDGHL